MDIVKESRIEAKNIVIMVIWLRICCSYLFTFKEFNKKILILQKKEMKTWQFYGFRQKQRVKRDTVIMTITDKISPAQGK